MTLMYSFKLRISTYPPLLFFNIHTGYYATLIRDVPYTMMELGLYENIKTAIRKVKSKEDLTQKEELMAAAVTGK